MPNVSIPNKPYGNVFVCDNYQCGEIHIKSKTGEIKPLSSMGFKDWTPDTLNEFAALTQSVVKILKRSLDNSRKDKE